VRLGGEKKVRLEKRWRERKSVGVRDRKKGWNEWNEY